MTFDDLGRVWQQQETGDFQRRKVENLSTVRGRAERLFKGFRQGKWIAAITVILCAVFFTQGLLESARPWLAGAGVIIVFAWLAYVLRVALELGGVKGAEPLAVRDAVQSEVRRLRILERFWGNAHWLFLIILVGQVMAYEGFRPLGAERGAFSAGFYVFLVALVVYGTVARRRDVRSKVRPLREELESWLAGLETFDFDRKLDTPQEGGA